MLDAHPELLEAARRIGPMVRELGLRAENEHRLPREVIRALAETGLADVLLAGVHAAQNATAVVEQMHRLAGTSGVYKRNRLERHLRDAATLRHHGFVAESRYEAVGQVFLGVQPEFGIVAF